MEHPTDSELKERGSRADGQPDGGQHSPGRTAAASETNQEPTATTGEPRVDAALALLERLPDLPVSEHAELFEQVHAQLSDVLGELDSGSAGPAGG
jgi:hypothetical protein